MQAFQKRWQNMNTFLGGMGNLVGQLGQLYEMNTQNRIQELENERLAQQKHIEETVANEEQRNTQIESLNNEYERKKKMEELKGAKMKKKFAIFETLIQIPMFLGPILLLVGFLRNNNLGKKIKIIGWTVFSFYWSTQPALLYISEGGDVFNASICIIGVYVLMYMAYHEWLSLVRKDEVSCINWIAGASAISGLIYFGIERTALAGWLIEEVARESTFVLNTIIGNATVDGRYIYLDGSYAVTIIFACTGVQAMVLFFSMIGALPKVNAKRKIIGFAVTVLPIYILNLFRNAMVSYLVGRDITDFHMAHNVLSKGGALLTLIILLFIIIKIIPEIFDEIICITDLHKRNGPIEAFIKKSILRKKG